MSRFLFAKSLSWSPTIALSWMWGLGFFYSMHIVWLQGWPGFWIFALANSCGLAAFGCILGAGGRDPEALFAKVKTRFVSLFALYQVAAVAITLYSLSAYLWPLMFPGRGPMLTVALSGLVVVAGCVIGHRLSLVRLRLFHGVYLAVAIVAIALVMLFMPGAHVPKAAMTATDTQSVWAFLLPTLVGFALGPWGDLQQWQRAIEIRRSGQSPAIAYLAAGALFLVLLTANAILSKMAGANVIVAADGALGAQSSVAARLGAGSEGIAAAAFVIWAAIAAVSTIDSFYNAIRWYFRSLLTNSLHPALAFVPASAAASPIWLLVVAVAAVSAMQSLDLSQTAYMMPYATLLVGAIICLIAASMKTPVAFDPVYQYLVGLAAAMVFFIGYREGIAGLIPLSTAIALLGAFQPLTTLVARSRAMGAVDLADSPPVVGASQADRPIGAEGKPSTSLDAGDVDENAVGTVPISGLSIRAENRNLAPSSGFDGQWFVMQVTPTYDDTNSVGNVYFANYIRWVGKARELFFSACMPKFDLETTRYYVLTRSFTHDFRREIAEFEPATIRIRIASHNRKFVTLGHEIISDRHGLLGRGEQSLMFVDRDSFRPLDIPVDIIRGFLPFWPSGAPESRSDGVKRQDRQAV
ncbi:acyl-CoA thioesterase [Jiella sp. MQZ9-1]|uniref:Acyl-CoA thioesterase n=1 Tax=Jiella flava TaxID=2816857 RepID=A0A939FWA7_9HYPH|nr:thioesterase family protein [Jiella flava]MBO0661951.1 acyl-CoA thioesterase [Jiella flava]MCD2470721.1 acyl-CoA thioesterase [Jiella flava]